MQLEIVDNEGNAGATRTKWCSGLRTGLFNPFRYFGDSALVRAAVREHQVGDDAGGGSTGQCAGDDGDACRVGHGRVPFRGDVLSNAVSGPGTPRRYDHLARTWEAQAPTALR